MSDTQFPALIFAAGFGTRMAALTQDRPKPLIEVAGMPLIDHTLLLATNAGCSPIVANLHYKADMLATHIQPKGVITIEERPHILETGGGLRNALPELGDGPVMTLNSDAIWAGPNPIELLQKEWEPEKMDALLICVPLGQTVGHRGTGDFDLAGNGTLTRGSAAVYGGIQIIKTDLLSTITESSFSLNLLWDKMLQQGRLYGLPYPGKWCDVGRPEGIALAEDMLRAHDV